MIALSTKTRCRRRRSQQGYTVLELLLGLAMSVMILAPLTAWAVLVMRQQPVQRDGMMRTINSGLLGSVFPSDVTVAGQASVDMSPQWAVNDCSGGVSANGSRHLVMISAGNTVEKVVYTVAPSVREDGLYSIWRRSCALGSDDTITKETELFVGVKPGSTNVSCSSPAGDTPCRQITLRMTPSGSDQAVEMSATRRINTGQTGDMLGDPLPVAVIRTVSMQPRTAMTPMTARFSASQSTVGPDHDISYAWEFASDVIVDDVNGQVVDAEFPPLGEGEENRDFTVRLTVSDDLGRSNTTFLRVSSTNVEPVASIARISPNPVNIGGTITLNALAVDGIPGSYDPDGVIQQFDWLITLPETDDGEPLREVWLTGPTATYATQAADVGRASIRLTVTDSQFAQSSAFTNVLIEDPTAPVTTTTTTTPPEEGQVIAAFTESPGSSALVRRFDASLSVGVDEGTTYAWSFGDGSTGSGLQVDHTYASIGTYTVGLTVTASDGRVGTSSRNVTVSQAPVTAPVPSVGEDQRSVVWPSIEGANNYLVNFRFTTPTDCYIEVNRRFVEASANPSIAIMENRCTNSGATTEVQVAALASGSEVWSGWITVPTNNGTGG